MLEVIRDRGLEHSVESLGGWDHVKYVVDCRLPEGVAELLSRLERRAVAGAWSVVCPPADMHPLRMEWGFAEAVEHYVFREWLACRADGLLEHHRRVLRLMLLRGMRLDDAGVVSQAAMVAQGEAEVAEAERGWAEAQSYLEYCAVGEGMTQDDVFVSLRGHWVELSAA